MNELSIVITNFCLYVILFVYCLIRYKWINLSTVTSLVYTIGALFSVLLFISPLYNLTFTAKGECSMESCIYLYIVNTLLILSLANININKCEYIYNYNTKIIKKIQAFLCVTLIVYIIFQIPNSIQKFYSGRNLSDMREELYGTNEIQGFFIIGLIARLFGATPLVLLCISCINLFIIKRTDTWDKYSIIVYFLYKFNTIFSVISRATIVFSFFELIVIFIIFYYFISARIKRLVLKWALIIVPISLLVFSAISTSRFGGDKETSNLATLRYAGEANLNFMALAYPDLKEPFWGYSSFTLYRRILGFPYNDGTSRDGGTVFDTNIQRVYKYPNPTYTFHGMAGSIWFNFGFYGCLIFTFIFYYLMKKSCKDIKKTTPLKIILYVYIGSLIIKGVCYLPFGSESDNLLLIYFLMFGYIMKTTGHCYLVSNH